jgi:hypothetical protein
MRDHVMAWLAVALLLLAGCASPPAADCAWVREIIPASEDQLTRNTAVQILAHNRKVREFCR